MSSLGYSIKVVARLTGLSPHVIRIWERRYGAVKPGRTSTNRRRYTDEEIERLTLLRRATDAGHSIKNVAAASTSELQALVGEEGGALRDSAFRPGQSTPLRAASPAPSPMEDRLEEALQAIVQMDGTALDRILNRGAVELSRPVLIQEFLAPLIQRVGDLWEKGSLKIAQEHVATASIRTFIGNFMRQHSVAGYLPTLIATTPPGQVHELGAILAAAEANNQGWRVCYLGPSLPAEEIAAAAAHHQAQAIALSIVYPPDDPHLADELLRLRRLMPDAKILVGGRAATSYQSVLDDIQAIQCRTIAEFGTQLARLRARARG